LKIQITIFDKDGNVVIDEESEADTASDAEIEEMVRLIDQGLPAHIAASLVKGSVQ
jgi:rRNA processing protein Krr1/Pno1